MKAIQVRNVPDETHRELRVRAAAAGMSLSDYVLAELQRVAARPPAAEVLKRAQGRAGTVPTGSLVAAVRSGRDRD